MLPIITKEILQKYDVPGPRYTSYPTAPEWSQEVNASVYQAKLKLLGQSDKTVSLYVHIPFCQSLCYFCGCNVVIRKQEGTYADEYLDYLCVEIDLIRESLGARKKIRQLHWGGGTPNFLSEPQIKRLFQKIQNSFDVDLNGEIAIEIDPRTIDHNKLKILRSLGFNRVSMGIQDFNHDVQQEINRIQPLEMVQDVHNRCRQLGFLSVNYDLIYGLARQTPKSFSETVDQVIKFKPDRIALYSFAYVPWLKKHQTKLSIDTLPTNDDKLDIFLESRRQLLDHGYQAIAMDHFALKTDEMAKAFNRGTLYRNFMGYTVKPADEYIGVGVSAIGFLEHTFVQNQKTLPGYYQRLKQHELPVERGKMLSLDDQIRQWVINQFMCLFKVDKKEFAHRFNEEFDAYFKKEQVHISRCLTDGLITLSADRIVVTDLGKIFIRNVCMGFDWYFRQKHLKRRFSQTV